MPQICTSSTAFLLPTMLHHKTMLDMVEEVLGHLLKSCKSLRSYITRDLLISAGSGAQTWARAITLLEITLTHFGVGSNLQHFLHCKHTCICAVEKVDCDIGWSWSNISVISLYIFWKKHQAGHAKSRKHKSECNRKSLALSQGHLQPVPDASPKASCCPAFLCLFRKQEQELGPLNG